VKRLVLWLALTTVTALGQDGGPLHLVFPVNHNNITAKNVSTKEILAYVVKFDHGQFNRDYYFKPQGVMPSAIERVGEFPPEATPAQPIEGEVTYVQFVDGSTWGDEQYADSVIGGRKPLLAFFATLTAAQISGGSAKVNSVLVSTSKDPTIDRAVRGMAHHFLNMKAQTGMDSVMYHLKSRVSSAAKHEKTLHP
jgi:hypothetical protein